MPRQSTVEKRQAVDPLESTVRALTARVASPCRLAMQPRRERVSALFRREDVPDRKGSLDLITALANARTMHLLHSGDTSRGTTPNRRWDRQGSDWRTFAAMPDSRRVTSMPRSLPRSATTTPHGSTTSEWPKDSRLP